MDLFDIVRSGQFEMIMSGDKVLVSEYYSVLYDIYKNEFTMYNKRELEIIEARYGLNQREEETQKDIAKRLKISRSYVSRIEKRATTKILREFLKNEKNTQKNIK